jgi:hypothetical protein
MIRKISLFIFVGIFLSACTCSGGRNKSNNPFETPDSLSGEVEIPTEVFDEIIHLANPVDMAALVKKLNAKYSNKYLSPTDNVSDYATDFDMALNLGIYGADLGYLNMYNKTNSVIDYITAIKTLADGIKVGQFFDFKSLKRLAQNNENLDSLMYISVHSFNQMDSYLRENKRSNLSSLIITGVWLEGLYLATQVVKENPHPELAERIGEQKIIMDNLMLVLEHYKNDKQFAKLISELNVLKEEFDQITITIQKGEPTMEMIDGVPTIIQNDVSHVDISDQRLTNIINKTETIRNKLISI